LDTLKVADILRCSLRVGKVREKVCVISKISSLLWKSSFSYMFLP